jgi:hypothetical protein
MKDIYGNEIGTTITFRGGAGDHEAQHAWPAETAVSAGRGVVFGKTGSYGTLFMEVYPPGASFIRGEGETPAACEDACWAAYQRALHCVEGRTEHELEPRGYKNGAGFCKHCNTFVSHAFTAEQLGQHCKVCGTATTWHWDEDDEGNDEFLCETCEPKHRRSTLNRDLSPIERILGA